MIMRLVFRSGSGDVPFWAEKDDQFVGTSTSSQNYFDTAYIVLNLYRR